jgi:hypothetical protein
MVGTQVSAARYDEHAAATSTPTARLVARTPAVRPFLVVGSVLIVAGGIVAAVTRPAGFDLGSWLAAYLVLVGGVAQIALGVGQALLADEMPGAHETRNELVSWNVALVLTILGSLLAVPVLTTLGAIALVVSLALFYVGVRGGDGGSDAMRTIYRCVVAVVLISTPVGVALSWIRHG